MQRPTKHLFELSMSSNQLNATLNSANSHYLDAVNNLFTASRKVIQNNHSIIVRKDLLKQIIGFSKAGFYWTCTGCILFRVL